MKNCEQNRRKIRDVEHALKKLSWGLSGSASADDLHYFTVAMQQAGDAVLALFPEAAVRPVSAAKPSEPGEILGASRSEDRKSLAEALSILKNQLRSGEPTLNSRSMYEAVMRCTPVDAEIAARCFAKQERGPDLVDAANGEQQESARVLPPGVSMRVVKGYVGPQKTLTQLKADNGGFFIPAEGYEDLFGILAEAHDQAAHGKGKERHAGDGIPFKGQRMQSISTLIDSPDGLVYQAIKKLTEGMTFEEPERRDKELLGAINYIAGIILWCRGKEGVDQ